MCHYVMNPDHNLKETNTWINYGVFIDALQKERLWKNSLQEIIWPLVLSCLFTGECGAVSQLHYRETHRSAKAGESLWFWRIHQKCSMLSRSEGLVRSPINPDAFNSGQDWGLSWSLGIFLHMQTQTPPHPQHAVCAVLWTKLIELNLSPFMLSGTRS